MKQLTFMWFALFSNAPSQDFQFYSVCEELNPLITLGTLWIIFLPSFCALHAIRHYSPSALLGIKHFQVSCRSWMGLLQGGADLVALTWPGDMGRMKVLFLSFPLVSAFGPSTRKGAAEPSFLFSCEKLPVTDM